MSKREERLPPLEQGLLDAMQAIDNQVARELQRTPAEREAHGVQKWEPFNSRIERLTSFILEALGNEDVELDGILVLAQAFTKALHFTIEDLGTDGLGKVRTDYCLAALKSIESSVQRSRDALASPMVS